MAQHCTLAVIGFDSEVTKKIQGFINQSYLDLRIEYLEVIKEKFRAFEVRFDDEYDIIILSSNAYSSPLEHIISSLKNRFPLTEIVLVTFKRDYDLVISAFRNGVRDIINYPISKNDFLASLEKSQSYRSLYQKSKSLSDILSLLNQFADFKKFSSSFDLMSRFDSFVTEKFQSDPFLILSFSKRLKVDESISGHFRTMWNKALFGDIYSKDEISVILDSVPAKELKDTSRSFIEIPHGQYYYYLLALGEYDNSQFLGLFKILKERKTDYVDKILAHLCRIVQNGYQQLLLAKTKDDLTVLIHHDDVTGLYNQRKLQLDLDTYIDKYHKRKDIFSVVFIDIDHFKSVNDGHGHLVGSQLLVEVAQILKACLRDNDLIYRYGGDEFVLLLPEVPVAEAKAIGERTLREIKAYKFISGKKKNLTMSVSIGVSEFPRDAKDKEAILNMADNMMYKAKNTGRGKVVTTEEMFGPQKSKKNSNKKSKKLG